MARTQTFRVFVSSTFSDLKAERNALQERVFPRLRELCLQHGVHFQAVDLRWGVSEEASLDQLAMNICLGEIERCQQVTPRPNFIVLLGDRYGWCPPPPQIPAEKFEAISCMVSEEDRTLLEEWYQRDNNAVPPEFNLQPRKKGSPYEDYRAWVPVEAALHKILATAVQGLDLNKEERLAYQASATHQEIARGALQVEDADEHVFCFFRQIRGLPQDKRAEGFLDLNEDGELDPTAVTQLEKLKDMLRRRLSGNILDYQARWTNGGVTTDHLNQLCDDVYQSLAGVIRHELDQLETVEPLEAEIAEHEAFGVDRARFFTGRVEIMKTVSSYLRSDDNHPMAVWGTSGSGKSALLAKVIEQAQTILPEAEVIYRFIGATPESSDGRSLLESLCKQIFNVFNFEQKKKHRLDQVEGTDETARAKIQQIENEYSIPFEFRELSRTFGHFLNNLSNEQHLILIIDALDQLDNTDLARRLTWLPAEQPEHVHILVSTLSGEIRTYLEAKLPPKCLLELTPMPSNQAEELLDRWLTEAGRALQQPQREELITKFEGCPRPLYLKLAFEEACRWESYSPIEETLLSADIPGLIRDLFDRLSSESHHGNPLVSQSMGYLAAAKNGLTEDEMLDVLARDVDVYTWFLCSLHHTPPDLIKHAIRYLEEKSSKDAPENELTVDESSAEVWLSEIRSNEDGSAIRAFHLFVLSENEDLRLPVVLWSRLYFELEPYLNQRSVDGVNLLGFYHQQVREVVEEKYLSNELKLTLHRALASYFETQGLEIPSEELKTPNLRILSELPYQLTHGRQWGKLKSALLNFPFLDLKVQAMGPGPLIEDFVEAEREEFEEASISLVQAALRLSAHILDRDRKQLPGQLTGRLLNQENPEIQSFLGQIRTLRDRVWLCPLSPSLTPPGGALLRTFSKVHDRALMLDKDRIVSTAQDGDLWVLDVNTGQVLSTTENHTGSLTVMAKINEHRVIARSDDKRLEIYDLEAGRMFQELGSHEERITVVTVVPGGHHAVSASTDGIIKYWDLETGTERQKIKGHQARIGGLGLFDQGDSLLSGSIDGVLTLWDLETGSELKSFQLSNPSHKVRGNSVHTLEVFDRGHFALVGCMDGSIAMVDIDTWDEFKRFKCHHEWVTAAAMDENGQRCIIGSFDGSLKIWDLVNGEEEQRLDGHVGPINSVAIFDDGRKALSASYEDIKIWDLESSREVTSQESLTAIAISIDGRHALAASDTRYAYDRSQAETFLTVWDLEAGIITHKHNLGGHYWINDLALFKHGLRAICASMYSQQSLTIFDLKTGKSLIPLPYRHSALAVEVFDEDKKVISGGEDNALKVWDLEAFVEIATLEGHTNEINAVAIFDDGKKAISASNDRTLKIWDLEELQEVSTLTGHAGMVSSVAVAMDGKSAVSGATDGCINVWNLETGKILHSLKTYHGMVEAVAAMSEVGLILSASSDGTLAVWDLASDQPIAQFIGEGTGLICCSARPDGTRLIAGGKSGQIHILELVGAMRP
jgi:WD40 repeat protein